VAIGKLPYILATRRRQHLLLERGCGSSQLHNFAFAMDQKYLSCMLECVLYSLIYEAYLVYLGDVIVAS
jgi:hypothetical protein